MTASGSDTRSTIMDAAEELILDRGFAGTTVEAIIDRAGLTKGSFFYHFDTKDDLARAIVRRYAELDAEHLRTNLARAEEESGDPLEQVIHFVRLFEEDMEELTEPYPGCLFASYCYQNQLFDEETFGIVEDGLLRWRRLLGEKLRATMEEHEPRRPVDADDLADMLLVAFEGGLVVSKTLEEPDTVARQLALYRTFLETLFPGD